MAGHVHVGVPPAGYDPVHRRALRHVTLPACGGLVGLHLRRVPNLARSRALRGGRACQKRAVLSDHGHGSLQGLCHADFLRRPAGFGPGIRDSAAHEGCRPRLPRTTARAPPDRNAPTEVAARTAPTGCGGEHICVKGRLACCGVRLLLGGWHYRLLTTPVPRLLLCGRGQPIQRDRCHGARGAVVRSMGKPRRKRARARSR
mmetsp:Transcript_10052/g.26201  ORF Transcript_10052/g.26201 Transcript_10052/m.26201 type:complete len:202 (+) Transcript_10052:117-722(+)